MQVPKFQLIGKTLTVRLDNRWPSAGQHSIQRMPHHGKQVQYADHSVDRVVVMCSLYEPCPYRPTFFRDFTHSLRTNNPELVDTPVHYVVHHDAPLAPVQTADHSILCIDSFEHTTKLIWDLAEHKHLNTPWNPHATHILFLVGKLRPSRLATLKKLLTHYPQELTYTLSRYLTCNIEPMSTATEQYEWWMRDLAQYYSAEELEAVQQFATAHETDTADTDSVQMTDDSQMFSADHLEHTVCSVISETVPWCVTKFYTEKTYSCIAAGRPFVHDHGVDPYLTNRGYLLYSPSEADTISTLDDFVHNAVDCEHTIQHNRDALAHNSEQTLAQLTAIFPEYAELTPQQQVDCLITFKDI